MKQRTGAPAASIFLACLLGAGLAEGGELPSAWIELQKILAAEQGPAVQAAPAASGPVQDLSGGIKFAKKRDKKPRPTKLFEKVAPSVVLIELFEEIQVDGKTEERKSGMGSGVIIKPNGVILTNFHVTEPPPRMIVGFGPNGPFQVPVPAADTKRKIRVVLYELSEEDGRVIRKPALEAAIIGGDKQRDIALLKVEAGYDLPALTLQRAVFVNEPVWAIGSPFGFEDSISKGVVSGQGRVLPGVVIPLIQTDAAINSGNSGGALVNRRGELIGINNMIRSQVQENNGVGFALPISKIEPFIDQILKHGKTSQGTIEALMRSTVLPGSGAFAVLITSPSAGGAAEKAGIKAKDLIVGVDGKRLRDIADLLDKITGAAPGQTLTLDLLRDGQPVQVKVEVQDSLKVAAQASKAADAGCPCGCGSKTDCGCKGRCENPDGCNCAR